MDDISLSPLTKNPYANIKTLNSKQQYKNTKFDNTIPESKLNKLLYR